MKNEYAHEYERAYILFRKRVIVHASTQSFFVNGLILEISERHFIIRDRKDNSEKLILFAELKKPLEAFREKNG